MRRLSVWKAINSFVRLPRYSAMSAPATKARLPAPVRMTTRVGCLALKPIDLSLERLHKRHRQRVELIGPVERQPDDSLLDLVTHNERF